MATRRVEGFPVQVEIHYKLCSDYFDSAVAYLRALLSPLTGRLPGRRRSSATATTPGGLTTPAHPFTLVDRVAHTLGHEDMLGHLCRHLISHVNAWESGRLIWVADIVSLAERFVDQIDWDRVRRHHPAVLDTLSLLHTMTPLSGALLERAGISVGRTPEGVGIAYRGWPHVPRAAWRERGYRRVLRDTLWPSEWWLRLRYRRGSARPLFWQRWVRHPLYVLGHGLRVCLEWMGWPEPLDLAAQRVSDSS